ncbi:MAG: hypothetical protein AMJ78_06495 [Omnitrophica WOR_2 bacterium SM23_29]|nr:MAG: hypothetical protein AMJ78_06495 [Omnitrophica WOR_2 bacterium SM23_29]
MKVLFIVKTVDFIDPLGIAELSARAKLIGHETFLGITTREDVFSKIERIRPDVIAYSAITGEHKYYFKLNDVIKNRFRDIFTIMGGPHPTFYPECIKDSTLDAICVGEGDEAFPELLSTLEEKRDISHIKNIFTRTNNGVLRNLIQGLDKRPFPDRDLFFKNTELGKFPLKIFMTSRGCPYPCTYCFNKPLLKMYANKGKFIRRQSVERTMDEISIIRAKYPLEFIKFEDDIFVFRADEWLEEFSKRYKREIGIPFNCLLRPDIVNEDVIKLLKEAGCFSISMAIDSGNQYIRQKILKRYMSDEQIIRAFQLADSYGINTFSNIILGIPCAKFNEEMEGINLNIKCKVAFADFSILMPYPKTEIGEYCIRNKIFDTDVKNYQISILNRSPLTCFSEKEKDIQKNISMLGSLAISRSFLRPFILRWLIYLPPNRIYVLINFMARAYLLHKKIFPVRLSFKNILQNFIKGLKREAEWRGYESRSEKG